jgi:hypothetical protein
MLPSQLNSSRRFAAVAGLALRAACAAPLDPQTAPPLRLEDHWTGRAELQPPRRGKEHVALGPAARVEAWLDHLFPPGTPTAVVQSYLERSGLECGPFSWPERWAGVVVCLDAYVHPSDPTLAVVWRIDILSATRADRLTEFGILMGLHVRGTPIL